MRPRLRLLFAALAVLLSPAVARAEAAPFDLAGPELRISVTRAGQTLPIERAATLAAGDKIAIEPELPAGQSVRYLLVAAFLRGATNPPPKTWFFQSQTWQAKGGGGLTVTAPVGAQQVLVFLAPATGGDFKTLVNAVRSRPGAFVRASQDLHQATLDRSRLDAYTAAIRKINQTEPGKLKETSPLLARSLSIKLDADCLQKTVELQAPCLVQGRDALVLADGHTTSVVQALTTGYSAELVQQLSSTPRARSGYYSPYVSSVLDLAHLMDSIRTAHYQYIPTLATTHGDRVSLMLNAPPSFQDPKSVLVVALPQIGGPDLPPLHPVNDQQVYCAQAPNLVLPVEGAPLLFSTRYAWDLTLRATARDGKTVDLPVTPAPERGGLAVDAAALTADSFGPTVKAALQGRWGFSSYRGPDFTLAIAQPEHWRTMRDDQQALLAGGEQTVRLSSPTAACVSGIEVQAGAATPAKSTPFTASHPDQVSFKIALGAARPRNLTVAVSQYGLAQPDRVTLLPFDRGVRLDGIEAHAGETVAVLKGSRLHEVTGVTLGQSKFLPGELQTDGDTETLALTAAPGARLTAGDTEAAVALNDGHVDRLEVAVGPPRPSVSLIEKSFRLDEAADSRAKIVLADKDLAPSGAQITFSLRAEPPTAFKGDEKVEIGNAAGQVLTTLTTQAGLTLADSQVAIASLNTGKAFNNSTAGALSFRVVRPNAASHWRPLATLVRLPKLQGLACPADRKKPCALSGSNLFLIDALSATPDFGAPVQVPAGYTAQTLEAPRPTGGKLYLRLHDDPEVVNVVTLAAAPARSGR